MRTNLLFITAALLLAFTACNKVSESIQRDVITKTDTIKFTLLASDNISSPNTSIKDLSGLLNLTEEIKKAGGFELKDIVSIKLSSFIMTQDSTRRRTLDGKRDSNYSYIDTASNFRNFSNVKVFLKSGSKIDSLAKVTNISDGAILARLNLSSIIAPDSLKAFVNAGNMKYDLSIQLRTKTDKTITGKILTNYTLTLRK
ncbi:hypothetical protein SAMN05421820_101620 [Pedobacter steynii]|uniref:Uncharacterized protein n=1 Tax=Pedobacter steynii TaxID=430522 RepID=A0A1G9KMI8_9SPHI|nr:hypothetical protein [Pedobacter steynii]NQX38590.1 hypothetical protein [Pedobacter steynii]SDL50687.1 hypothetical protein SAMN05421820_101620 [Pedobacter steynii]